MKRKVLIVLTVLFVLAALFVIGMRLAAPTINRNRMLVPNPGRPVLRTATPVPEMTLKECATYMVANVLYDKVETEAAIFTCIDLGIGNRAQCAKKVAGIYFEVATKWCKEHGNKIK